MKFISSLTYVININSYDKTRKSSLLLSENGRVLNRVSRLHRWCWEYNYLYYFLIIFNMECGLYNQDEWDEEPEPSRWTIKEIDEDEYMENNQ